MIDASKAQRSTYITDGPLAAFRRQVTGVGWNHRFPYSHAVRLLPGRKRRLSLMSTKHELTLIFET